MNARITVENLEKKDSTAEVKSRYVANLKPTTVTTSKTNSATKRIDRKTMN